MDSTDASLDGVTWRSVRPDDTEAIAELMEAAEAIDHLGEHFDADDIREHFLNDLVDVERDTRVAELDDGALAAAGMVHGQTVVRQTHNVWCFGTVHPAHRRRGIGQQLLHWQLERGAELHAGRHPASPATLAIDVGEHDAGRRALAEQFELQPTRHWFEMERMLPGELSDVVVPEGFSLEAYDPARDEELRQGHNDAFAEHFGSTERTPEEWRQLFTGSSSFRPELSLLGVETSSGKLAGYALGYVYAADVAATGRQQVWLGQIGTLQAFRGLGLGRALLARALAVWAEEGMEEAALGVDTENVTGALGLYERAGFSVSRRSTSWARHLDASPSGA